MLDLWKRQFTAASFSLSHEDPNIFVISQWQRSAIPSVPYLFYRICMSLFFVVSAILSIVDESNLDKPYMFRVKWVIYLTNWGFTFCTLQSVLCTGMLIARFFSARKGNEPGKGTALHKVYWATNIIATDAACAITVLYWIVIFDAKTMPLDFVNITVHAVNSALMIVELLMVAHPVKITHAYLSVSFGGVYTIFSAIYYLCGGTSRDDLPFVYNVINWSKPLPTLGICVAAMVFMIIIHCCSYGVYRCRALVASKLIKTDNSENVQIPIKEIKGIENTAMSNEV